MKDTPRIIISGGGTGGHIFPAISIANAIKRECEQSEILFVGAVGKMEMERVPAAGYEIKGLTIAGLKRSLSISNLKIPFLLLKSLRDARRVIKEFKPHVVVGVGGYASAPTLWSAGSMGIPYLIQEQNSYAGITNRILSKRAAKVCVAYHGMDRFFSPEKILLTGNPVRDGIKRATQEEKQKAKALLGIEESTPTILVVGGSLGAGTLNRCLKNWMLQNQTSNVTIIWQCGKYYFKDCNEFVKENPRDYIKLFEFIKEMDMAFAAADVVISRAGAGTISELCIAAKASIFVPSPNVAEDHQTHNALSLVKDGAAEMVADSQAELKLMQSAYALIGNRERIIELEDKIGNLAMHGAAGIIAKEVLNLIKKG